MTAKKPDALPAGLLILSIEDGKTPATPFVLPIIPPRCIQISDMIVNANPSTEMTPPHPYSSKFSHVYLKILFISHILDGFYALLTVVNDVADPVEDALCGAIPSHGNFTSKYCSLKSHFTLFNLPICITAPFPVLKTPPFYCKFMIE